MSLLEICIGLAVVSIMVFFAAPSLIRARENYELDQTTRQLAGQMEWTRLKAITHDQDYRFRLISTTSYVIECKSLTWLPDETVTLPRGFHITASATPQFYKRGNAAPASTITVWDRKFNSKNVVINITGRVRVE
jgi:Tfp pilus assembly protein FimT